MTGLHEVDCGACGKRHVMSAARARSQRVLRCDCGQFVRLDRTLAETRSDPAPAATPDSELADAFDDEATHMFSSLEDIAALRPTASSAATRMSIYEEDDAAATRVASSALNLPRPTAPPARPSSPAPARPSSPAPARRPSSPVQAAVAAADKPLWYVDLGGTETVEMTIEQLILARRSGKLGEGALVWRAGMPRWRPIGSLIPAAGSGAPRQTVPPAAPVRAKQPTPVTLGSYERPLATLEFALEKPVISAPRERAPQPPSPAKLRPASQPPPSPTRAPTPIPRAAVRSASQVGPLPAPTPLPPPARLPTPTPVPAAPTSAPPGPPSPPARAMAMPLLQRSSPMPPPRSLVPVAFRYPWRGPRPRWLSIAIAVFICVAASGSGAFMVRALKIRRQPLSLSPTQLSAATATVSPALPTTTAEATLPAAASSTEVVDIDSLSVEHRAPRAQVRLAPALPSPAIPPIAPNADKNAENADTDDSTAPAPTPQPAAKKAKASDLPAAAHSNPYTGGDSAAKKAPASNGDDPGF